MKFTIPLPPRTKKNSQQILVNRKTGKPFISQSKLYKDYEEQCGYFIPKNIYINYPVEVVCKFYRPTRRRMDLTNALEAIDDIMVKYGLLADDNCDVIVSHDGSRVLYDKDNPRTEVEIRGL